MDNPVEWTQWVPPRDPRRLDGKKVTEDEHGRLIESADCGLCCPGCGICCAGYRDRITADYAGAEEFEGNLKPGHGGLVPLEGSLWHRVSTCGEPCPGYGRCCPPFEQRHRPETVANARRVLFDGASPRWQMQEALLILAHEGTAEAVEVLESFMPRAHTRLAGFAECALDEGRCFASVPRNAEEARVLMKREVRAKWEDRAVEAYGKTEDVEAELERLRYEVEIAQRLLDKAQDEAARENWRTKVDVLEMLAQEAEGNREAQQREVALCDAMVAEIDADLPAGEPGAAHDRVGAELF